MSAVKQDAQKTREETIRLSVQTELAEHVVKSEGEGRWRCSRPQDCHWSFRLVFAPYLIVLYGDVYELVLRPGAEDSLAWLRSSVTSSAGYWLEKIPVEFRRDDEFSEELARAYLGEVERKETFAEFHLDVAKLADALDEIDAEPSDEAFAAWADAWREQEVDYYDVPDPRVPAFWTLAQCECLRWFVAHLPAPVETGASS